MRNVLATLFLALTAACASTPPPPPPMPPPAPQPTAARRPPARPVARPEPRPAGAAPAEAAAPRETYRVRSDGVVGCAEPEALRQLRDLRADEAASPRQLAEAHRAGRCMTTFSNRVWTLDRTQGELLRLRLVAQGGAGAVLLWFARDEVEPAGTAS